MVGAVGALIVIASLFVDWYDDVTGFTAFEVLDLVLMGLSIATLLALARRLIPERLPVRLDLLSVEVGPLDHFGEDLSPAVAAAVPRGVELALSWVRGA